ncbi:tautomerase family protein [Ciceribacter sp. L1K23]|uniref:tautomerase family protein n=1 Tax=Ciceribacter sp. L1K23 TaxID=2820276 RepID=UPI001B81918A|nr:tautomerase family protein [Ciceribacter sp. L1K23]MBR0557377.1 tautomerase family protein [Ciceribacter sp. L1K23]
MPILNVKISGVRSDAVTASVSRMLQDHTQRILHKDPALTAIAIDYIDPRDWFVGGKSLAEQKQSSVYLNIKITDETNTKDEKAAYIRAVFDGFSALLGTLHEESYIHVEDVRAAAYGYGGKTQERRYHEGR